MASKSFSTQGPEIPHLSKGEVADLRSDVEAAFTVSEARTGFPEIYALVGDQAYDFDGNAGGDQMIELIGVNFGTDPAAVTCTIAGVSLPVTIMNPDTLLMATVSMAAALALQAAVDPNQMFAGTQMAINLNITVAGVHTSASIQANV